MAYDTQVQVADLTAAAPVAADAPPTAAAPVVYAETPQMLGANDLIDYLTKKGQLFLSKGAKHLMSRHFTMALP
jgi:hypothetical protein